MNIYPHLRPDKQWHPGWIGFDLDGTLAKYERGDGIAKIGEPIQEMVDFAKSLLEDGLEIRILTARVSGPPKERQNQVGLIEAWCLKHLGQIVRVTNEKDFEMWALYDDRAFHVIPNTGKIVAPLLP